MDNIDIAKSISYYSYLFMVMLLTGMRIGEALALRWTREINIKNGIKNSQDIDFDNMKIHIQERYYKGRFDIPKTSGFVRSVDILSVLLKKWKLMCPQSTFVFPNRSAGVANYESVTDAFKTFLKKCGIKFKPIHILRNTNASIRLKANQPITYVAHQLGHANPEITLRIYSHLIPQDGEFAKQQVLALENTIANFRNQNPIRKPLEMSK